MSKLFRKKGGRLISEINVTPFVDVLLVLLIIFMISAPMMTAGIDVNLPKSESEKSSENEAINVTLKLDGSVYLDGQPIKRGNLRDAFQRMPANKKSQTVQIRADQGLNYGSVVSVMSDIKSADFESIGLITDSSLQ